MKQTNFIVVVVMLTFLLVTSSLAQFGKNKVQYDTPTWKSIQSKHFEVFFPDNGYELAIVTAEFAEQAYKHLTKGLDYKLDKDDRITIITHLSHNQFQQSNVSSEMPEESVGGFTEFLKTRVVIPYEGNWEKYRHVIHHELTHAIMLRKFYGRGIQSVITGITRMPIPLWFIEGIAEYQSRFGWDYEADMFIRDAVLNDWLPPIDGLGGYMYYKGGQSILVYIEETYGKSKVVEFVNKIKQHRDFNRGVKACLGMDVRELSAKWQQWVKNKHWKLADEFQSPTDFAVQMTDREKVGNAINNAPSISPNGDRIAYLSDRSDYFDLWLMNVYDGKILKRIIKGQRTSKFEELHWLQSGISWDPTGTFITFGAKANGNDALYVVNTNSGDIVNYFSFPLDGVYSPTWSPDGSKIAFQGFINGVCDLYYVNYPAGSLIKVTNEIYTDADPAWHPDSKKLLFTSDRGNRTQTNDSILTKEITSHPVNLYDIYSIDTDTKQISKITNSTAMERTPVWIPNQNAFVYTNNKNGIFNLYKYDFNKKESTPITNVNTGIFQPSISKDGSIAFTSFYKGGYDVYLLSSPFQDKSISSLKKTIFQQSMFDKTTSTSNEEIQSDKATTVQTIDPSQFVFDDIRNKNKRLKDSNTTDKVWEGYADTLPIYVAKNYQVKLTPDLLFASAGFSSFSGFQGMGQIMLSDLLGNHVVYISTDLYYDIENTNINAVYFYLPRRIDSGFGVFHNVYFFNYGWTRDRSYGSYIEVQYPISRFLRIDGSMSFLNINRSRYTLDRDEYVTLQNRHVLIPSLALVRDNSVWGYTGPVNGERFRISASWSPDFDQNKLNSNRTKWGLDFHTIELDYRKYFRVNREQSFALRLSSGYSEGKSPQRFFLGGESNSFTTSRRNDEIVNEIDNVFFSSQVTPLRGTENFEFSGTRYVLFNSEFRYPLIKVLAFGWPLPAFFSNIRGTSFMDVGTTWYQDKFKGSVRTPTDNLRLNDVKMGFGVGARISLGFALLKYDLSWRTDWMNTSSPNHVLSLGPEF